MADRWWRRGAVRTRTTLLATVVSGTALLLGAGLLLFTLDQSLHQAGDDLARGRVQDLVAQAKQAALPASLDSIDGEGVGQVYDDQGTVLAASPNIAGRPPIYHGSAPVDVPEPRTIRGAPDDNETENYRVWVMGVDTDQGRVTVLAGASLESVSEASRTLRRDLVVGVPMLVALVAFGTWVVIGRTLRPVEDIRTEVAAIGDDQLDRRVPVPAADDEINRLAVTMNQMLARLEDASRRQRAFVADASHELQSPITSLRTQLEVALAHGQDDWPGFAARLLVDTDQMERLVRDLLFLARTSSTGGVGRQDLVDLDDVVMEEAARIRSVTSAVIDTRRVSAAPVTGNADELRRVVRNLLENAARHAVSTVTLSLASEDSCVRFDVVDDGPGIAQEDLERIFDRFTTVGTARSRGTGTGLGLAIARSIAVRHGGRVEAVGAERGAHFLFLLHRSAESYGDCERHAASDTGQGAEVVPRGPAGPEVAPRVDGTASRRVDCIEQVVAGDVVDDRDQDRHQVERTAHELPERHRVTQAASGRDAQDQTDDRGPEQREHEQRVRSAPVDLLHRHQALPVGQAAEAAHDERGEGEEDPAGDARADRGNQGQGAGQGVEHGSS